MKITDIFFIILISFCAVHGFSQSTIEDYVKEGIPYHDKGEYDKAIGIYKKALKIDSKSALVNYEIAFSYFAKGDYKKAIKYSDVVLKQNNEFMIESYITKGSSLDNLGKTKKSIKLFKKAIEKTEGHYLLHYNLALNYYKINEIDSAEESAINAILSNSNHSSSHLLLAAIHDQKGNAVQTLMAIHYFLFLEPNSPRSLEGLQMLDANFGRNVTQDEKEPTTTNIRLFQNVDGEFRSAELMVSMLAASNNLENNTDKTEYELFVENTASFFTILGKTTTDEKRDGIWWNFYQPFYYGLAKSEHLETYCKYLTQHRNPESKKCIDENPEKLTNFGIWLEVN